MCVSNQEVQWQIEGTVELLLLFLLEVKTNTHRRIKLLCNDNNLTCSELAWTWVQIDHVRASLPLLLSVFFITVPSSGLSGFLLAAGWEFHRETCWCFKYNENRFIHGLKETISVKVKCVSCVSVCSLMMDWIGFLYAGAIALGGFMGYKRKGWPLREKAQPLDEFMKW